MPPTETPPDQAPGHSRRGPELTPIQRAQIIGAAGVGASPAQIAATFGFKDSTVRTTIRMASKRQDFESQPRSGRPKKYTDRDERIIYQYVLQNPKASSVKVRRETGLEISTSTIKRILHAGRMTDPRARRRSLGEGMGREEKRGGGEGEKKRVANRGDEIALSGDGDAGVDNDRTAGEWTAMHK